MKPTTFYNSSLIYTVFISTIGIYELAELKWAHADKIVLSGFWLTKTHLTGHCIHSLATIPKGVIGCKIHFTGCLNISEVINVISGGVRPSNLPINIWVYMLFLLGSVGIHCAGKSYMEFYKNGSKIW